MENSIREAIKLRKEEKFYYLQCMDKISNTEIFLNFYKIVLQNYSDFMFN